MKEVELTKDVELILPNGNRITGTELLQMFEEQENELKEYIKDLVRIPFKDDFVIIERLFDPSIFNTRPKKPDVTRADDPDKLIEPIVYDRRPRQKPPKGCFSVAAMEAAVLVKYDIIPSKNLTMYQREMANKITAEYNL